MNVVALYLPQYHRIPENDKWWGEGHTEWTTVKKGKMLYDGQYQPREPLNDNYYDLLDINIMRWQTELAKKHGVNAFCVYHYWFNGKLLLEKPMENFLNSDIDFPFFFCWANEKWTKVWDSENGSKEVLADNDYANIDFWISHFNYCLQFFKDQRYIKNKNKPVFVIYNPIVIPFKQLQGFIDEWNRLAILNGFSGIDFIFQTGNSLCYMDNKRKKLFSNGFEYYPGLVDYRMDNKIVFFLKAILRKLKIIKNKKITLQDYDDIWTKILNYNPKGSSIIPGAFTDWDNSARRKVGAKIILNASPSKFEKYFTDQIFNAKNNYKKNMIVIFAWNEWSEGGYLEPDKKYGLSYLNAIKSSLEENGEFSETFDYERVY